jgi:hypothetical protein
MEMRINRVESKVHATDSDMLMDPGVKREIVRMCVSAVKEELQRDQRIADEARVTHGVSSNM